MLPDAACRLSICPYAAALADDKMSHVRHLIWRTVPLKCPSVCSIVIGDKSKALRARIMKLLHVVKFVPNVATASRDDAVKWLLSSAAQLSIIAKAEGCSPPATADDIHK